MSLDTESSFLAPGLGENFSNFGTQLRPSANVLLVMALLNFFWHDNWHPVGLLLTHYRTQFAVNSGSSMDAKDSCIACNNVWTWPFLSLPAPPFQPKFDTPDSVTRSISLTSEYQVSCTWSAIWIQHPLVTWHKLVWHSKFIPRHSFIIWIGYWGQT